MRLVVILPAEVVQIVLSEKPQQVAHQQDQQYCAKPYACTSADAPTVVAEVSSATAENQHQNNNQNNDEHFKSPLFWVATPGLYRTFDCELGYATSRGECTDAHGFSHSPSHLRRGERSDTQDLVYRVPRDRLNGKPQTSGLCLMDAGAHKGTHI